MAVTEQQHRHTTWIDYHRKILEESAIAGVELLNNACDDLSIECLNDEEKYLNAILENPKLNFILVPSASGKGRIDCIHHCSAHEDEFLALAINMLLMLHDCNDSTSECFLALGDNTSGLGWIHRSGHLPSSRCSHVSLLG